MPSPLIKNMIEQYGYPVIDADSHDDFIHAHDESVLFFTESPTRFPESDDVCMILPELVKEYGERFQPAVVAQDAQRKMQGRYGFSEWPALVFLRRGQFLGVISRVQDWNVYIQKINDLLTAEPKPLPGIGIVVEQAHSSQCGQ